MDVLHCCAFLNDLCSFSLILLAGTHWDMDPLVTDQATTNLVVELETRSWVTTPNCAGTNPTCAVPLGGMTVGMLLSVLGVSEMKVKTR